MEKKTHFILHKKGKRFVVIGITTATFMTTGLMLNQADNVHAAETPVTNTSTTTKISNQITIEIINDTTGGTSSNILFAQPIGTASNTTADSTMKAYTGADAANYQVISSTIPTEGLVFSDVPQTFTIHVGEKVTTPPVDTSTPPIGTTTPPVDTNTPTTDVPENPDTKNEITISIVDER